MCECECVVCERAEPERVSLSLSLSLMGSVVCARWGVGAGINYRPGTDADVMVHMDRWTDG